MADNLLTAETRSTRGSRPAGRLRREGHVPAVIYGMGSESESISVPAHDLQLILASDTGANTLITLRIGGGEQLALARQIQRHHVKGSVVHVDFIRVSADIAVSADVPVHLDGDAEGVKRGGVLEQLLFSVAIEAKPTELPPSISADVAALEIGDQLHVRDLAVPPGVTITADPDELVVQVSAPRVAEEEAAAEGEGVEAAEGAAPAEGAEAPAAEASPSEE